MPRPLTEINGIGPATAEGFRRSGIADADTLIRLGADAAYAAWLAAGNPPHFIGYYSLVMALQGRPWNDCRGAEKTALRQRFDTLKAETRGDMEKGRLPMEAALDEIGVGLRRQPTISRPEKKKAIS